MAEEITVKILGARNELNGLYLGLSEKTKETIKINTTQELAFQKEYALQGTYNKNKVFIAVDPALKEETMEGFLGIEETEQQEIVATPDKKTTIINIPAESKLELSFDNIKRYIQPKATNQEIQMFLQLCLNQNLNPFIKDAYLVKYGNSPATIVVSKDAFLKKAESLDDYQGFDAGIVVLNQETKEIERRKGSLLLNTEELIGGWASVYRDNKRDFYAEVSMIEYDRKQSSWNKMPCTMIRKVALVQAIREAFPSSFQGMYDGAEMDIKEELK